MKTRTKLLTAVLSTVTALSCALTAAALTAPTLTLQGNENAPAKLVDGSAEATLTLKASDFKDVAGAKLTLTLPTGITLGNATVTDTATENKWELKSGENYAVKNNTVTLVDVFNIGDATIKTGALELELKFTVKDTSIGQYKIGVAGDFADAKEDLQKGTSEGVLVIGKEEKSYTAEDIKNINSKLDVNKEFIPYGGAYTYADGKYTYYEKDKTTGEIKFGNATNVTVLKCKLPAEGKTVTSFGASEKIKDPNGTYEYEKYDGIQFGAYATDKTLDYGTLVIMGDYNAFKEYTGQTDEALLAQIMQRYDAKVEDKTIAEGDGYTFKYGKSDPKSTITVKKVKRTTFMWQSESAIQYAVRLYKLTKGKSYTTVAYSVTGSTYSFSTEIQTEIFTGSAS